MISNIKHYQPLMIGDKIEINNKQFFIVGIEKELTTNITEYTLLKIIENRSYIDQSVIIRMFLERVEDTFNTDITKVIIKNRILKNLSDVYCKYVCPINIKNISSKSLCEMCNHNINISPSSIFFLGDEVRCNQIDENTNKIVRGFNSTVTKIILDQYSLSLLEYKFKLGSNELSESYCDLINRLESFNKEDILDLLTYRTKFNKKSYYLKRKELRLRNRKGFTWDFNDGICESCIFKSSEFCHYDCSNNDFINSCKKVLTNYSIVWKEVKNS